MKLFLAGALALVVAGCAKHQATVVTPMTAAPTDADRSAGLAATEAFRSQMEAEERDKPPTAAEAIGGLPARVRLMDAERDAGMASIVTFQSERGCVGPGAHIALELIHSAEADSAAIYNKRLETGEEQPLEAYQRDVHVDLTFTLADAALAKKCLDVADVQYRHLLNTYTGNSYSGIRQRAQVGIEDVRDARHYR